METQRSLPTRIIALRPIGSSTKHKVRQGRKHVKGRELAIRAATEGTAITPSFGLYYEWQRRPRIAARPRLKTASGILIGDSGIFLERVDSSRVAWLTMRRRSDHADPSLLSWTGLHGRQEIILRGDRSLPCAHLGLVC